MDRKEAEMRLRDDWYINLTGNLIVEHYKIDRFLEACGVAIAALQETKEKGHWIGDFGHSEYNDWHCSNCRMYYPERNKKLLGDYCPWCGADMRGEEE